MTGSFTRPIKAIHYTDGLYEGSFDDLSMDLCGDAFASEHVRDLADRIRQLRQRDRAHDFDVVGSATARLMRIDLRLGSEPATLHIGFRTQDNGQECIEKLTSDSPLWRRLVPDPQVSNRDASVRYARIVAAGLAPGVDITNADESKRRLDRFFPEDSYPYPCGVMADFRSTVAKTARDFGEQSVLDGLALLVAFCPYIDLTTTADGVASAAPSLDAGDVHELLVKMRDEVDP